MEESFRNRIKCNLAEEKTKNKINNISDKEIEFAIANIEKAISTDANYKDILNNKYNNQVNFMLDAEIICKKIEKNNDEKDATKEFYKIVLEILNQTGTLINSMHNASEKKNIYHKLAQSEYSKVQNEVSNLYEVLGDILDRTKIIDSLVSKSNTFFEDNDLNYLRTNREKALEEFSKPDKNYHITLFKSAFWINKLAKYTECVGYYNNYQKDTYNSLEKNENRILFLSKMKTELLQTIYYQYEKEEKDYYNKICELLKSDINKYELSNKKNTNKIDIKNEINNIVSENVMQIIVKRYSDKYNKLFNPFFKDLNLEKDLDDMDLCNTIRSSLYSLKTNISNMAINELLGEYNYYKNPNNIKKWGLLKDESGKYLIGMNLFGYPLPITMHIPKSQLKVFIRNYINSNRLSSSKLTFPLYESMKNNYGNLVKTNILSTLNSTQRDNLQKHSKKEPENKFVQALYNQTKKDQNNMANIDKKKYPTITVELEREDYIR